MFLRPLPQLEGCLDRAGCAQPSTFRPQNRLLSTRSTFAQALLLPPFTFPSAGVSILFIRYLNSIEYFFRYRFEYWYRYFRSIGTTRRGQGYTSAMRAQCSGEDAPPGRKWREPRGIIWKPGEGRTLAAAAGLSTCEIRAWPPPRLHT
ncbi:hypothetical protein J6590_055228 [Homalodisca vitripennis]|nr:hypothetical protein J6590_055228 [Homalodisca vitripennis]